MQAHVKMPHIKIDIKGDIPAKLVSVLKEVYGKNVKLTDDDDDTTVDIFDTDWFKKTRDSMTPGSCMKVYRELHKMTQQQLGEKLGGITRQNISHMERGTRAISKHTAKMLSRIFDVPVDRFI